ncbi:MAG: hypothetical protein ACTJG2_01110 [Candidatus Saccharimonadales bacterium]
MTDRQFALLGEALEKVVMNLAFFVLAVIYTVIAESSEGLLSAVFSFLTVSCLAVGLIFLRRLGKTLDKFKEPTSVE